MEKRIAIYEFETTLNTNDIVKRLLNFSFTKESLSGFSLSRAGSKGIIFKHIKKNISTDIVVTPFGEEFENTVVDYTINNVKLLGNELYIFNPSRSLLPFRNELLKALDFKCTISNKSINLDSVLHLINSKFENVNVTSIEAVAHDIFVDTRVKMTIESNKDLLKKYKILSVSTNQKITKLGFEITFKDSIYFVELSCKGIVKIKGALIDSSLENQVFDIFSQVSN